MPQPTIEVLGAYKVELTPELFEEAMALKYPADLGLSAGEREEAEGWVREELSSIALLEILVNHPDERFDLSDVSQPESDQAAYDEAFLSRDGTSVISRDFKPEPDDYIRVAFFLHYFDPARPLVTSYGEIPVPPLQEMPDRLGEMVPYTPVD